MVKTTVTLEDEIYRKLAREALEKYGRTRNLSRLINEKLKTSDENSTENRESREIAVERAFGSWKIKETGKQYARRLRKESENRLSRFGI
jgi:hypothetical protein